MDRDQLIAAGFKPTTYEGQAGEFLTKRCRVEDMPYAHEHVEDGDMVLGTMEAITEVTPDGRVQLLISDADYVEGPIAVDSDEGQALIADAVAAH